MIDKQFKKEAFKESVKENVKFLYRKKLEEATQEQIFQAVCYTVKDVIIDNWLETQNAYKEQDPKTVYYMSMEFLMGRALGNNLINLTAYKEVKEALDELGLDLNVIEDQEPDPALGNGGLYRRILNEQYRNQHRHLPDCQKADWQDHLYRPCPFQPDQIGRASCRERV